MAKNRGPSKKKPTQKQLEARYSLQEVAAYAKKILEAPALKAYYQSKAGPGQNTYNMAIKGTFKAPEGQNIRFVDMSGCKGKRRI